MINVNIIVYKFYDEKNKLVLQTNSTEADAKKKIEDFFGYSISIVNYELMKRGYIRKGKENEKIKMIKEVY